MKKGIFYALFFCAMVCCSAGTTCIIAGKKKEQKMETARDVESFKQAAIDAYREVMKCSEEYAVEAYERGDFGARHVTDDEYKKGPLAFKQIVKEALRDIIESSQWDAFEKAYIDTYANVLEWTQESILKAYKVGAIGITNASRAIYESDPDAFRKIIKEGLERTMQDHKLNKEGFRAALEKSSEEKLKEQEEVLGSFMKKKLAGKKEHRGQQEAKSSHTCLTENEYRRACIDCFSEFADVPKEHVERAYHVNFFWRRQMLEELYNKNPAGFRENLKDLYKYQAKMWNRDMDAVRSSFYDAIKSQPLVEVRPEENEGASEKLVSHRAQPNKKEFHKL